MNKPLFICGPSGVGKSYLVRYLTENFNYKKIITLTTRPPRENEISNIDYEFVTEEEFESLDENHQLAISDYTFGYRYGMRLDSVEKILKVGKIPVCEIYSPHIQLFSKAFPNAIAIFLMPESLDLLERRMRNRGDNVEEINRRILGAREEIQIFTHSTHQYFFRIYKVSETNFSEIVTDIVQILKLSPSEVEPH